MSNIVSFQKDWSIGDTAITACAIMDKDLSSLKGAAEVTAPMIMEKLAQIKKVSQDARIQNTAMHSAGVVDASVLEGVPMPENKLAVGVQEDRQVVRPLSGRKFQNKAPEFTM